MKSFLITYQHQMIEWNQLVAAVSEFAGSNSWLHLWPGAMILQGPYVPKSVSDFLHQRFPTAFVMVTEITAGYNTFGWMAPNVWEFITDVRIPKHHQLFGR